MKSKNSKSLRADRMNGSNARNSDGKKSDGTIRNRGSRRSSSRTTKDKSYKESASSNLQGRNALADPVSGVNDVSWYTRYPSLSDTTAMFPYPNRPGMAINVGRVVTHTTGAVSSTTPLNHYIPGVMAIRWAPALGFSSTATDPASVVAKEMYAKVRASFSGALSVDAPEFIMYCGALDSIFSYIAHLKRIYRVLCAWTPENFSVPGALLEALGLTPTAVNSLRANRTQFLNYINELVLQSRKFKCPAVMDIFNRHYWMNDNVYLDAPTIASQMYCFTPTGFYFLDAQAAIPGDETNTAAGLRYSPLQGPDTVNAEALYNFGATMIRALDAWDDGYTISGYLQRAYEGVASFFVELLDGNEQLTPLYVEEVLMQIENSRPIISGTSLSVNATLTSTLNVYQDPNTNAVVTMPGATIPTSGQALFIDGILTVRSDKPTTADNIIASRLQTIVSNERFTHPVDDTTYYKICCGTEVVIGYALYAVVGNSVQVFTPNVSMGNSTLSGSSVAPIAILEEFDWHPLLYYWYSGNGYFVWFFGDSHNVAVVPVDAMEKLNRVCVFSEFNAFSV